MAEVTKAPELENTPTESQDEVDEAADTEPYLSSLLPEEDDHDFDDEPSDEDLITQINGGEEEDLAHSPTPREARLAAGEAGEVGEAGEAQNRRF
jgi:hypothetical protein